MRDRERILANLEATYREIYSHAEASRDQEEMVRLDFQFQRDQLFLEAILDVRDLLVLPPQEGESGPGDATIDLLEKAQAVRRLVRFR